MRRYITLLIFMLGFAGAQAQSHLNVAPLFDNPKKWETTFSTSHIEGKMLKPYNLTLFRSLTTTDRRMFGTIEKLIEKDGMSTIDKECGYIDGKLYYAFYMFKPRKKKYQYLFYRNSTLRNDEPDEVSVVYIEGYVSLQELKKMFK